MICTVDGVVRRGRTVNLSGPVPPEAAARAIREGTAAADGTTVSVIARRPHAVHERVGCLRPGMGLRVRTALAGAARARGLGTPSDPQLRRLRDRLRALDPERVDTTDERERLAAASADTDRLREAVATARGRLQARRREGLDTETASERLEESATRLSEVETRAAAARQSLDRRRQEARRVRDQLDERLRLEDRVANLERCARRTLVDRVRDAYAAAVADVPRGPADPEDPFDVEALTAGLAVARVADFDAPVVVACERFEDPTAASRWLGAPVLRV